jgi:hypothetical protein
MAADPRLSPTVATNPDMADLHLETGRRNNEIHKVVVSDSLTTDDTAPWTETTTIVRRRTRTRPSPSSKTGRAGTAPTT